MQKNIAFLGTSPALTSFLTNTFGLSPNQVFQDTRVVEDARQAQIIVTEDYKLVNDQLSQRRNVIYIGSGTWSALASGGHTGDGGQLLTLVHFNEMHHKSLQYGGIAELAKWVNHTGIKLPQISLADLQKKCRLTQSQNKPGTIFVSNDILFLQEVTRVLGTKIPLVVETSYDRAIRLMENGSGHFSKIVLDDFLLAEQSRHSTDFPCKLLSTHQQIGMMLPWQIAGIQGLKHILIRENWPDNAADVWHLSQWRDKWHKKQALMSGTTIRLWLPINNTFTMSDWTKLFK
jgi:hypothetical protein